MANSPAHRFGQVIGDLLEEIIQPILQEFCDERGLYLDKKGIRGSARSGRKVSWEDAYGNSHDMDFVIESGGGHDRQGRPLAFIETAWRRYTKHSRAKAQEIQGAVLPIADKYEWDRPFTGAVLAGFFTQGSVKQLESNGIEVALFPYEGVVNVFKDFDIDIAFDEVTPDGHFQRAVNEILGLEPDKRIGLKKGIVAANQGLIEKFFSRLQQRLDRQIVEVIVLPLHGGQSAFNNIKDAIACVEGYDESSLADGEFRKYEIIVRFSNMRGDEQDKIDASFKTKERAINFLSYIQEGI
ncbi:DNA methylase [Xanthomonas sp. MWU16-30325]|uniref:DNA methylase n=1 Tax=Xanthomonas sp. MWU16-30325 TaxID=2878096 RepID=UPI001CF87D60|nr:DNA methylase [Xanthomonas sp. MWU16-30325]